MKIRQRVTLWIAAAGLITSLFFSMVVFLEMAEQPIKLLDAELKKVGKLAFRLLEQNQFQPRSEKIIKIALFDKNYWIRIYDHNKKMVYQSELARLVDLPINDHAHQYTIQTHIEKTLAKLHQDTRNNVTFRVRIIKLQSKGKPFLVQIARPIEGLDEEIVDLIIFLVLGLAASTILLILLSYFAAGRVLKPISSISALAKEINEKTLDKRIPLRKSRDELYQLSNSLNRMFDRLQYSFTTQKQFLAGASHELRTPITMLRLFMDEAVHREDLDETFRQHLINQRTNLFRMERLVNTLLKLSTLELKNTIDKKDIKLTELIETVVDDFAVVISAGNLQLKTRIQDHLHLEGGQDEIRRLLINILDNAIKYNCDGGKIELEAAGNKGFITISLQNSGPGIPQADLENVFEQFYRVEKSRSLQYGGAGLGLAIVKQIVKLHEGSIKMESTPGSWSRITIKLPKKTS